MAESSIDGSTGIRSGCCVLRLTGVLDGTTYRWLRDLLVKLAVEQPVAVIVDLDDLRVEQETSLTVFSSVWMQVNQWPGVPILLVASAGSQRARLGGAISRFTPCYAAVGDAVIAAGQPPARRRATLELEAATTSSRVARAFVRETCQEWGVSAHASDAEAVAIELVDNVSVHAGTTSRIRLELRNKLLTIAVRDGSPRPAVLRERIGTEHWGNGLRIIAELSRAWGCSPELNGGKVVWAVLACD
ncbi:MAG: ATP-binding protein [Labedaea sp.]